MRSAHLFAVVLVSVVLYGSPASALVLKDFLAYGQRLLHYQMQFKALVSEAQENRRIIQGAFNSMKSGDWKNLALVDTLRILDMPWFDGIEGIDDIRKATDLTVLNAQSAQELWKSADDFAKWRDNPRYSRDPWFKKKVDSLTRQSRRAVARRAALFRQMQAQNRQLQEDIKHIDALRAAIEATSKQQPVNQAKLTALQSDLAAVQAKYQGQNLMLVNQRAIMGLVGENDAQEAFREQLDRTWEAANNRASTRFGAAFSK